MERRANPHARRVSKHAIIGILSALVGITSVLNSNFAAASAALAALDVTDSSSDETLHAIAGLLLAGLSVATYWRGGIRGRKAVPRCTPEEAHQTYLVNVSNKDFNRHFRMPRELFYKFRAKSHLFNRELNEILLNAVMQLPVGEELARVMAGFQAIQNARELRVTHVHIRKTYNLKYYE